MIFEVAVAAAGAAAAAYALRTLRNRRAPPPEPLPKEPGAKKPPGPRGLKIGDVLLYADAELWLSASVELREEGEMVARLFRAPGNERAEWVMQLDREAQDIAILSATDAIPPGRVPAELPNAGIRHHLEARGTVTLSADGEGMPTAATAEYVILSGTAGRMLFVLDPEGKESRIGLAGERLSRDMLDLLPGD